MRDRAPILHAVLHDGRRSLGVWALALAAVAVLYLSFYPSMSGDAMDELVAELPDDLVVALGYDRIGTAAGWMTTTIYGLLGPILLLVFAIGNGARLLAGAEVTGDLDLELASPVPRRRVLLERGAAATAATAVLVVVITVVSYTMTIVLDLDIELGRLLGASLALFLLVLGYGLLAFAVGAVTGRPAIAQGVAGGLAVAGFMADALGPVVESDWLSAVSPFTWYLGNDPLVNGLDGFDVVRLAAITAVAVAVAVAGFDRRDIMV